MTQRVGKGRVCIFRAAQYPSRAAGLLPSLQAQLAVTHWFGHLGAADSTWGQCSMGPTGLMGMAAERPRCGHPE